MSVIPLHRPYRSPLALERMRRAFEQGPASFGPWTRQCESWLAEQTGALRALLTPSATAALHCCARLIELGPGDEVLVPAWTFPSTVGAFALSGAVPVFVDVRADTLNLDETQLQRAITPRTRAIVAMHYAGVACDMDSIMEIATQHGLYVVEDAAQALLSRYRDRPLGGIGNLAVMSFHDTKNLGCGEGGTLLVNDPALVDRAECLRDKGTDRSAWMRGEVDHYQWQLPSACSPPAETTAALLSAQLEHAGAVTADRLQIWNEYHGKLSSRDCGLRLPAPPRECGHNGHIFHLRARDPATAARLRQALQKAGIECAAHYQPLHLAPGAKGCRVARPLPVTEQAASTLLRLPIWAGLPEDSRKTVVDTLLGELHSGV